MRLAPLMEGKYLDFFFDHDLVPCEGFRDVLLGLVRVRVLQPKFVCMKRGVEVTADQIVDRDIEHFTRATLRRCRSRSVPAVMSCFKDRCRV